MTEAPSPALSISQNTALGENEVALIFQPDGDVVVRHNCPTVAASGVIRGGKIGAGFVMALACLELMGNDDVFTQAMRDAAARLESIEHPQATGTVQ